VTNTPKLVKPSFIATTLVFSMIFVGTIFIILQGIAGNEVTLLCLFGVTYVFNFIFWIYTILKFLTFNSQITSTMNTKFTNASMIALTIIALLVPVFVIMGGIEQANDGNVLVIISFATIAILWNFLIAKVLWIISKAMLELEGKENITKSIIMGTMVSLAYFPIGIFKTHKRLIATEMI